MSGHHNHRHRSSHHSRSHSSHHKKSDYYRDNHSSSSNGWTEHRSSSGKVYYYNHRSGISQWELPSELRQQRPASPESEVSESSSIRQQQENSPSSSASSHKSVRSDSALEDKPLLTPSLAQYFKPELISSSNSSRTEELESQAAQVARDVLLIGERILKARVEIQISKWNLNHIDTQIETQSRSCQALRRTIERVGAPNYE